MLKPNNRGQKSSRRYHILPSKTFLLFHVVEHRDSFPRHSAEALQSKLTQEELRSLKVRRKSCEMFCVVCLEGG